MVYLIDPVDGANTKCGFVVKPLYGIIVCPPVYCSTLTG